MNTSLNRRLLIAGALVVIAVFSASAIWAASTWGDVTRISLVRETNDPSGGPVAQDQDETEDQTAAEDLINEGRQVFLLVGSDSREDLEDTAGFGEFEGTRADVVMLMIKDGEKTGLLSLPRDLLVGNPCGEGEERLSVMLEGCGRYNGPSLLTLAVEKLAHQEIDHFAMVDLAGFQGAVDAIGGYEICVDNPVRDQRANLELPAGCTQADGEQTLAWMRSRHTQELTDSGWLTLPGMNDLARNERQRAFLIDMMGRISDFSSPQAMASAARAVAPYVTVDSELGLATAVDLALTMRGLGSGDVTELEVPVYDATTDDGAAVLMPAEPVDQIVAEFLSATADAGMVLGING
ncbi:MAG TPA: LCP family protein [Acidimicrobiia bacterium]|jgi:LCP family protein required for cell wall assembly|nr:LCP family protein [Acidimicrobiia bacterium]